MRLFAASLVALFALCASAWVAEGQTVDDIEFTGVEIEVPGEIDEDNRNDYFRVWNLDPGAFYEVGLDVFDLALVLFSDDFADVLDYRADDFPMSFEDLLPNQDGELFLAVCATDVDQNWTLDDCETGVTFSPYWLTVEYVPEPGGIASHLAALLSLALLSRERLRRRGR